MHVWLSVAGQLKQLNIKFTAAGLLTTICNCGAHHLFNQSVSKLRVYCETYFSPSYTPRPGPSHVFVFPHKEHAFVHKVKVLLSCIA